MILQYPVSAKGLVPHRRPMRMVDTVLSVQSDGSGKAEFMVSEDNIFLDQDGFLAPEALAEMMAQTFAAVSGCLNSASGHQPTGYLVGIKRLECADRAGKGQRLCIEVWPAGDFAGFVIVEARVSRQNQILATGELKIWQDPQSDQKEST